MLHGAREYRHGAPRHGQSDPDDCRYPEDRGLQTDLEFQQAYHRIDEAG